MPGKWINEGENKVANILFKTTDPDAILYLGLYISPTTEPPETAVLGDLIEPAGFNYDRIALTRGSWVITDDLAEYAQQTFQAIGGEWGDVWGYFITDIATGVSGGLLLAVEQFSSPVGFWVQDGSKIKITPKITII